MQWFFNTFSYIVPKCSHFWASHKKVFKWDWVGTHGWNLLHLCQWMRSSLVQEMACPICGSKIFPKPMLTYCQLATSAKKLQINSSQNEWMNKLHGKYQIIFRWLRRDSSTRRNWGSFACQFPLAACVEICQVASRCWWHPWRVLQRWRRVTCRYVPVENTVKSLI